MKNSKKQKEVKIFQKFLEYNSNWIMGDLAVKSSKYINDNSPIFFEKFLKLLNGIFHSQQDPGQVL